MRIHTDKEEERRRWEEQKRAADEWAQATREIEIAADDLVRRVKWAAMNAPGNAELGWIGRLMSRSTSIAAGAVSARERAEAKVVAIVKLRLEPLPAPAELTPEIARPTTIPEPPSVPYLKDGDTEPRAGDVAPPSDDDLPF